MIKQYMPTDNKVVWDAKRNCRMFKVRKGEMFQTNKIEIQKKCEEFGYEEMKQKELDMIEESINPTIVKERTELSESEKEADRVSKLSTKDLKDSQPKTTRKTTKKKNN